MTQPAPISAAPAHAVGVGTASPSSDMQPPRRLRSILSLDDLEQAARRHLPRPIFGFICEGAETNASVKANRQAYGERRLMTRVLVDTSRRSLATTLLGTTYSAPFGIAPMGGNVLAAYEADLALARAAREIGIPFVLSASSLIRLEEVAEAGDRGWFQAYLPGEPERILPLVDRVAAAGFSVFMLTVDLPVPGNRENNIRNGFSMPLRPTLRLAWDGLSHPRWLMGNVARTLLTRGMPHFENMDATRGPPILSRNLVRAVGRRDGLSWAHVEMIRKKWPGKLVIKGILSPEDTQRAREAGADGVVVSNHGGRQLDGACASLDALPAVAAAAGDMAVMIDGGIRRGTDVLKALALGADFVFVGRPFLYGVAVGGEAGVRHAAGLLSSEIDRNMALMGLLSPRDAGPWILVGGSGPGVAPAS